VRRRAAGGGEQDEKQDGAAAQCGGGSVMMDEAIEAGAKSIISRAPPHPEPGVRAAGPSGCKRRRDPRPGAFVRGRGAAGESM
jgi:hypothetical protein